MSASLPGFGPLAPAGKSERSFVAIPIVRSSGLPSVEAIVSRGCAFRAFRVSRAITAENRARTKGGPVPTGRAPRRDGVAGGIDQFGIVIAEEERRLAAPTIAPSFQLASLSVATRALWHPREARVDADTLALVRSGGLIRRDPAGGCSCSIRALWAWLLQSSGTRSASWLGAVVGVVLGGIKRAGCLVRRVGCC